MSNRHHLPAGQNMQGAATGMPNMDMSGSQGGLPRRRPQQQPQYMPQYHHPMNPMYQNYNPYNAPPYYQVPPQYQNGGMPSPGYMPYQGYGRSPQMMHQYVPMAGVAVPPNNYPRHSPHSPSLSTPYQPPLAPAPMPSHTPSSSHSSQIPQPQTPPVPQAPPVQEQAEIEPAPAPIPQEEPAPVSRVAFRPPLPWFSQPDLDFPARTPRSRRRRKQLAQNNQAVSLPADTPSAPTDSDATPSQEPAADTADAAPADASATVDSEAVEAEAEAEAPAPRAAPTSWANLFTRGAASQAASTNGSVSAGQANEGAEGGVVSAGFSKAGANSMAEAIQAFRVQATELVPLLEPRGLINTGNMCYMNSILQVLMFCVPFYDFLDQVGKRAAHSFKSETPLLDAMIMFSHEFKTLKSAPSVEQLQKATRPEEFDKTGDPFTPEFVYEAIRQLSRFDSMRRGHQQDAEEFLGFLLQSLDDECRTVMNNLAATAAATSETSSVDGSVDPSGDWLEVGRKQRSAVTRSSGLNTSTPITKIFGGLLRSELRVPGLKDSIITEPYQPLQLDIGSPEVRNVADALRGLTRPERLQGDFNSARGKEVTATKQVFIESLPPVLILQLKRFQFNAEGGIGKLGKKIGYPLELEIPREALSRQTRQTMGDGRLPRYKLISVVYHHGRNASGGHYTVDVRRQDGREWLRLDDTVLRRIRSEDVAEMGSEEEVKETRKETPTSSSSANRFGAINDDDDDGDEDGGWNQVTASAGHHKRWSSIANSPSANGTPSKEKYSKDNFKDNRVAYLLFYERM